ncbi:MAG: SDR family oxidoreductase [Rhodothermales bacterium]|nr:SDR family oxidoreductase [Rhodothermales bacterium]MBO6778950.1 SDR family oxidoreductase [Rhodothermales bacterium]
MDLKEKNAIVTGASAGLGLAVSRQLADRGARVFGLARRKERLAEARAQMGDAFVPVVCDVTDESAVGRAMDQVGKSADTVDILINNAGLGRFGLLDDLSLDDWDLQMATNLRGVFLCTRAVLPRMKAQNSQSGFGGHIVNVASVAGLLGNPRVGAYNATKFGLRGLSESLMKEVRDDGIKVTCLYPGSIETEFFDVAGIDISANPMTADDVAGTIVHTLQAPDNYLISEVVMRPLRPRG